jgi:hypothetical protein
MHLQINLPYLIIKILTQFSSIFNTSFLLTELNNISYKTICAISNSKNNFIVYQNAYTINSDALNFKHSQKI